MTTETYSPAPVRSLDVHKSPLEARQFLPFLAFLFVGSGCAALIYEIVWLQLLQLAIGASAISLGVLLGTFMGGMCLGSLLFPRVISRAKHPLRVYAVLEILIGVCGLLEIKLVPAASELYRHLATTEEISVILRAVFAGVCLLPPTIMMGATLPAIARWVQTTPRGVSWLGFFYGGNIVGAVIGCMLAGFYLLPTFDMATATYVAAVINAAVATLAIVLSVMAPHRAPAAAEEAQATGASVEGGPAAWTIYLAIGLSGLTGLGAEVIWTRLLSLTLGATVYTFSNILAVFLLGLGIGSSVGAFISRSARRPRVALAWCQFLLVAGIGWAAYAITFSLPFWPINLEYITSTNALFEMNLAQCFWAIMPAALLWGASFPLALGAMAGRGQDPGKLVGRVYAANTVGGIFGALFFSMLFVPQLGTQGSTRLLMALCTISGIVALLPIFGGMGRASESEEGQEDAPASLGAHAVALFAVVVIAFGLMIKVAPPNWDAVAFGRNSASWLKTLYPTVVSEDEMHLLEEANTRGLGKSLETAAGKLVFTANPDRPASMNEDDKNWVNAHQDKLQAAMLRREALTGKGNILAYGDENAPERYCTFVGEGMNVSVAVTYSTSGYRYFHGAGKVQASSDPADMRLQRTLGHISALTAQTKDGPKDVLVVACGAGVTAGTFVPYDSNITIVDIERMVPTYVTPQFAEENYHVVPTAFAANHDPLGNKKTTIHIDDGRHFIRTTTQKFDVITSDPIDPWVKGCAALNTVEYYTWCKEHLKPGGVMALWIPLYESSEETSKSVIATFFKVFPYGILWSNDQNGEGYDAVLYGAVPKEGEKEGPLQIDIDEMQAYIEAHPAVRESMRPVSMGNAGMPGTCEAVELLATYAGTAPRMPKWLKVADDLHLINWDSNLRLQYVAGKNVNLQIAPKIFRGILKEYAFPEEIFHGSPERMAALKALLAQTGRVERQ